MLIFVSILLLLTTGNFHRMNERAPVSSVKISSWQVKTKVLSRAQSCQTFWWPIKRWHRDIRNVPQGDPSWGFSRKKNLVERLLPFIHEAHDKRKTLPKITVNQYLDMKEMIKSCNNCKFKGFFYINSCRNIIQIMAEPSPITKSCSDQVSSAWCKPPEITSALPAPQVEKGRGRAP